MVVHIVMIKFKDGTSKDQIEEIKSQIDNLFGRVPTLLSMDTGLNFSDEDRAMDLSLIATFDSKDDLKEYAIHPEHLKVIENIKKVAEYSKVVDYEAL